MKKIFIFGAIVLASVLAKAQTQQGLDFNFHYEPEKVYTIYQNQENETKVEFSGSKKAMQKLKKQNLKNPIVDKSTKESIIVLSTGKSEDAINYPVSLKIIMDKDQPESTITAYGKGSVNDFPILESVSGDQLNDNEKAVFIKVIQSIFSQLKYPKIHLNIGETATAQNVINIPLGPMALEMDIESKFMLMAIKNNMAEFDVSQNMTMKSANKDLNFKGGGSGSGKAIYDMLNNCFVKENLNIGLEVIMPQPDVQLKITLNSSQNKDVKITNNTDIKP